MKRFTITPSTLTILLFSILLAVFPLRVSSQEPQIFVVKDGDLTFDSSYTLTLNVTEELVLSLAVLEAHQAVYNDTDFQALIVDTIDPSSGTRRLRKLPGSWGSGVQVGGRCRFCYPNRRLQEATNLKNNKSFLVSALNYLGFKRLPSRDGETRKLNDQVLANEICTKLIESGFDAFQDVSNCQITLSDPYQ